LINGQPVTPAGELLRNAPEPSMTDTIAAMRQVLAKRFGIKNADLSEDLELSSLGLDSLAFIEYAFELEGELHIHFPDVPRDLATIGDFARFVHAEVLRQAAGRDLK
jgi:acyl carrier protein